MKALLLISLFFSALQVSAVTYDHKGDAQYDASELEILASCDATRAKVRNWYVLARNPEKGLNYGKPTLFFNSRGNLKMMKAQQDMTHVDDGRLYEIYDGEWLSYIFNLTQPGRYSLLMINKNGVKAGYEPCRATID